jgi:triosephosphate isomerase (TIM)
VRRYYIAGNWKMHKTVSEAVDLASQIVKSTRDLPHKVMIAPPFTALAAVAAVVKGTNLQLGAQNMAREEKGAHTGEISVLMLADIGVQTVILGHSERRLLYGENDSLINAKVRLALSHGLEVILCVGETLEQREAGKVESVVVGQIEQGLTGVQASSLRNLTIAYEPVWAIGTGKNATPEDADAVHKVIRGTIGRLYSAGAGDEMTIQYGGSVKPDNASQLLAMKNIDGALVGGASLAADSFTAIASAPRS